VHTGGRARAAIAEQKGILLGSTQVRELVFEQHRMTRAQIEGTCKIRGGRNLVRKSCRWRCWWWRRDRNP